MQTAACSTRRDALSDPAALANVLATPTSGPQAYVGGSRVVQLTLQTFLLEDLKKVDWGHLLFEGGAKQRRVPKRTVHAHRRHDMSSPGCAQILPAQ
eukprot:1160787-Amphidinium_carterae.1